MAGGVALNCVANGRVIRETPMKNLFVQPAAGDAGGAVGVAHYIYNTLEKQPRGKAWTHAYLGPEYKDAEIKAYLDSRRARPTGRSPRQELLRDDGAPALRGQRHRLVPGAHGVRAARAGRPQHPGRPARPEDARHPQHEDQVPRGVPPLRALRAGGQGVASGSRSTATAPTCCWWPRCARASARSPPSPTSTTRPACRR